MRYCICGKPIVYRSRQEKERGHREREYCSDRCRQRACRERNKGKHDLDRIRREAQERWWLSIEQSVRPDMRQIELDLKNKMLEMQNMFLNSADTRIEHIELLNRIQQMEIADLKDQLAEKEAEIVRLNILLEAQTKKKRPPGDGKNIQ
jgi:hypothetical protein